MQNLSLLKRSRYMAKVVFRLNIIYIELYYYLVGIQRMTFFELQDGIRDKETTLNELQQKYEQEKAFAYNA